MDLKRLGRSGDPYGSFTAAEYLSMLGAGSSRPVPPSGGHPKPRWKSITGERYVTIAVKTSNCLFGHRRLRKKKGIRLPRERARDRCLSGWRADHLGTILEDSAEGINTFGRASWSGLVVAVNPTPRSPSPSTFRCRATGRHVLSRPPASIPSRDKSLAFASGPRRLISNT